MYLVRLFEDDTRDNNYAVDNNYYCVGLYSRKEDALKRSKEITDELLSKGYVTWDEYTQQINDSDYDKIKFEVDILEIEENKAFDVNAIFLGGGTYYE